MDSIDNVTITIFVRPDCLRAIAQTLNILESLDEENKYVFTPSDIVYTKEMISNYVWLNIPIRLFIKFEYCYNKLKK